MNKEVKIAIISVPNSFTDSQRQATFDAAYLAGLNCQLINDTTSAAIAYAYDKNLEGSQTVLIYDLGGYYLNVSIFKITNGIIEVISACSYPELGGQIFDCRMVEHLVTIIKNIRGEIIITNKIFQTLLVECEKAKRNLSNSLESI